MSSDESDVGGRKRKRKPRLPDGPASISSGSPIIGSSSSSCRRQNVLRESSSSDPESGAESDVVVKRKKTVKLDTDSDFSSSESDSSPIFPRRLGIRGHLRNISESEDSDASSIIVPHRFRNTVPLQMSDQEDEEDGTYQWVTDEDSDKEPQSDVTKPSTSILREENAINSDSSDGHSEKCPICLISFRLQEVGVPENCVHTFCLECIEEWSKNMNTCPVDRKEYNSITVRKCLNGKVVRKIPIQRPETQEEPVIIEDPTFCEVCGLSADEDRLLLCDGCDLGFHLYCLEPPLIEVPEGAWYCNNCGPDMNRAIGLDEVVALMDDADDFFGGIPFGFLAHRRTSSRLMPRTRHSERVRHRVERNRSQRRQQQPLDENTPSTSDGRVSSNRVSSTSATPTKKPRKKRKRPNKRSAAKYKTVWVLNEFGEAVPMKRRVKGRRRKIKKKLEKKTVKKRLASQLGVCASQQVGQSLPDVRISSGSSSSLGYQRFQAGIPRLDILGTVNRLDYFSQSEDEGISNENEATGVHTLFARRSSNSSGALRRVTRRKAALVAAPTVSSTTDILDSIMNSQERLLSKNSVLSVVDSSGKLIIEDKTKEPPLNNNSPSKPDFNSYRVKETPWHGRNYNSGYRPHNRNSWSGNRNSWQQQNSGNNYNNYPQRNSSGNLFGQGSSNYFQNRGQSFQNDIPQDYTQRTLCEAELLQGEEKEKPTPDNTSQLNAEAEVDVYGDIENESVSTSRIDEHFKPATPPQAVQCHTPNTNTDEDNDSESGMVIDTERGPDEAVSSTVGIGEMYDPSVPPPAYNLNHPSPTQHTYSPGQPTDSPENPQYSPGEPTYSPEGSDAQCNAAPSFDQVEELKSGFDELQKEFASGLKEFQMSIRSSVEQADDNEEQDISTNYDEQCREVPVSSEVEDAECLEERNNEEAFEENQSLPLEPHNLDDILMPMENAEQETKDHPDDDEVSNDGCPNFSIYSRQSKSVALTTDISLPPDLNEDPITDESSSLSPANQSVTVEKTGSDPRLQKHPSSSLWNLGGLYSDSEDESVVKKTNTFGLSDIKDMTEDILSEEERSYTPVLDERPVEKPKEVFEGLDTELISDDDRNDFDESHEQKTASEGDALEINAKESELEFTRPDDFEEGEIVDKNKEKVAEGDIGGTTPEKKTKKDKDGKRKKKEKEKDKSTDEPSAESIANKENVNNKESFKKLTKSNKERNYRDKDKATERSRSKTPATVSKREESKKKKEKRKELERYNVRAIIAEKPRPPPKDQFGRDIRQSPTRSRSRSYTPPIAEKSPIRARASPSPIRAPSPAVRRRSVSKARTPPRGRSPTIRRRSASRSRDKSGKRKRKSRSKSADKKGDRFRAKKRRRSTSRSNKRKKSKEKGKKRRRSGSRKRHQSRSLSPRRSRREWTPSLSRSLTPPLHHGSPSWTPPRADVLRNQNLTVIVNNEAAKKKKDKRNKDKRRKDDSPQRRRRRDRERTPPPSKEVFASGDNILVSVSFNNENESRDVSTRDSRKRKEASASEQQKRSRERRNKTRKDLSGIKPVAIIDLERSPFQEIESSPKDVIVLSDSDNNENEKRNKEGNACDSSQQVASPEETPNYSMGPKTPPEPSVKFSLLAKPQQVRAINNPLHDPLEAVEEEQQDEMSQNSHKGPNTPPEEPPTSAPSSPDAYDPFEPTKSRSQTPEPRNVDIGEQQEIQTGDRCTTDLEKAGQTPDVIIKSLTPPVADIQPADSQSSVQEISESKSPDDRSAMLASQQTITKPVAQTVPFSPVQSTLAAAVVPVSTTVTISRINILSSAMISPVKPNPVKILPTKAAVKSTPIKPMLSKFTVVKKKQQNGNTLADANLELDSPYSPGSSDYDDLFEPPSEPTASIQTKSKSSKAAKASAGGGKKSSSAFDTLFGSPNFNKKTTKKTAAKKPMPGQSKTKHVGVKVDEDSLKILEDLPNSAVEMQVKDKFLKKLNRQERVVEEVKLVLKPFYNKKKITKEEYKDIMRRAVPKICHNKSGEINPLKIRHLTEAYVKKLKHSKKVTSSSSLPQKVV